MLSDPSIKRTAKNGGQPVPSWESGTEWIAEDIGWDATWKGEVVHHKSVWRNITMRKNIDSPQTIPSRVDRWIPRQIAPMFHRPHPERSRQRQIPPARMF